MPRENRSGRIRTPSAGARLKDADYEGHSLTMLQRIAEALDLALDIRMVPKERAAA